MARTAADTSPVALNIAIAAFAALSIGGFGCALANRRPPREAAAAGEYRFLVTDNPARQRFEVSLEVLGSRRLCVDTGAWPTPGGYVFDIRLVADGGFRRKGDIESTDYRGCVRDCYYQALPGAPALTGHVDYARFGDPARIAALPGRRLDFSPRIVGCHESDWIENP